MTTRLLKSDVDDWKKLERFLTWILNTIEKMCYRSKGPGRFFTWIDAEYAVHATFRGHNGGTISMGYVLLHEMSSKKKINVNSSTEEKLVGVSEYLPYNIWFLMFMDAQGYVIKGNFIFQDNQSTTRMHKMVGTRVLVICVIEMFFIFC